MYKDSLTILFRLLNRKNKQGLCIIRCRITYLKKRKEFSTGIFIPPEDWDSSKRTVKVTSPNYDIVNTKLSLIHRELNQKYLELQLSGNSFTVEDVFSRYVGKERKSEIKLIDYFEKYLEKQSKLIGKDLVKATWTKYRYVCNHLQSFVWHKYKTKDIELQRLNMQFLSDFEYFLKTELEHKQITINKIVQRFRRPIRIAVAEGLLDRDPFALHKPGKVTKAVVFLTYEELLKLEKYTFSQERLNRTKDLFVFCCYTGLAYNEMANLMEQHIVKGFDGAWWIRMRRSKTSKIINIPLLPKALNILSKYKGGPELLPIISNQKMNSYLKEIADIVGIDITLTHHVARKTFASSVLLFHEVPMEIVSELLGHSSLKITQSYYGKIVNQSVSQAISRLKDKL